MDTQKIRLVVSGAKYKSLSRAAEEFSYTPSALSHALASLEDSLGVRLFSRSTKGVELTREGEALLPYFDSLLDAERALCDAAAALSVKEKMRLRIAAYSSISRNLLTPLLKEFKKCEPNIEFSVDVADGLGGWLENGLADIVFADSRTLHHSEFVPIADDPYLVIAPPEWFLDRDSISLDELYRYPYIDTEDIHPDCGIDSKRFRERIIFRSVDDLSVIDTVREGMGVTILPALVLKGNLDGVRVMRLVPELKRRIGFAYKKNGVSSPELEAFIGFVKKRKNDPDIAF